MKITPTKLQNASIPPSEVGALRRRVHSGETTTSQEADRYGVGIETVRRCVRGETFRHIREGLPEGDFYQPHIPAGLPNEIPAEAILDSAKKLEGRQQ